MKYNHAYDVAFEVISTDPDGATPRECLIALKQRVADLEVASEQELYEVFGSQCPFDTYDMDEDAPQVEENEEEERD
jgi:hypothetical protein